MSTSDFYNIDYSAHYFIPLEEIEVALPCFGFMISNPNHMALVVDEFGGIDGLVTLQDVVSEIVGDIQQNKSIFPQIVNKQDGSFAADAKMLISECEEKLGVQLLAPLEKEECEEITFETLGGLVMYLAGRMPTRGETLMHPSGIEFEIAEADNRRVKRLIIRKRTEQATQSAE